jgi:hypothetical protein
MEVGTIGLSFSKRVNFLRWRLCVGCLVACQSSLGMRGRHHWKVAILVVHLEYRVSIPRVKTQGLTFTGCAWQWPCLRHYFGYSDFLQGENPRSSIGQRQCLCIVFFLEELPLENLFVVGVLSLLWFECCCCECFITAIGSLFSFSLGCLHP